MRPTQARSTAEEIRAACKLHGVNYVADQADHPVFNRGYTIMFQPPPRRTSTVKAADLALLAHPQACKRCFWLRAKAAPEVGYEIGDRADLTAKELVRRSLHEHDTTPSWLPIEAQGRVSPGSDFKRLIGDVVVTGVPDDVLYMDTDHTLVSYTVEGPDTPQHVVQQARLQILAAIAPEWMDARRLVLVFVRGADGDVVDATVEAVPLDAVRVSELAVRAVEILGKPMPEAGSDCPECRAASLLADMVT